MSYKIKFTQKAIAELNESIFYYNEQQNNLGSKFKTVVYSAIEKLKINPFYQIRYDEIRCFYTKPFPFLIHYRIVDKSKLIIIIAILHTSRNIK